MAETQRQSPSLAEEMPASVREVLEILDDNKGEELVVLDMRTVSGFTEFMVLTRNSFFTHCLSQSPRRINSLIHHKVTGRLSSHPYYLILPLQNISTVQDVRHGCMQLVAV